MNVNYVRINPSGNITLLVTDAVERSQQSEAAKMLMRMDPGAEQVGFIENAALPGAAARLQMMGGEFCGNATMSAASWLAWKQGLPDGEAALYPMEVSGARAVIPCRIVRRGEAYIGTVPMPLPREIVQAEIMPGVIVPLVRFEGIDHVIIAENQLTARQARELIAPLCASLGADALGILLLDAQKNDMRPLVYVKSTDSAVWENSCGSGTAAVGAWQAMLQGRDVAVDIQQPCPDTCIRVSAAWDGSAVAGLEISGKVRIEKSACAEL